MYIYTNKPRYQRFYFILHFAIGAKRTPWEHGNRTSAGKVINAKHKQKGGDKR